ncbi:hypothetical protein BLOT_004311, partial [Blomia tropicalis]
MPRTSNPHTPPPKRPCTLDLESELPTDSPICDKYTFSYHTHSIMIDKNVLYARVACFVQLVFVNFSLIGND